VNYPLWEVPLLGGSLTMATVAIIHVFIAQFAVGGGLFLALVTRRAYAATDRLWLDYLRKHSRFFMITSLLFGAVTGVGIWFTIGLINPQATSLLIRIFVWGWAIEWCFFLIEISAILLYYYGWDRVDAKTHQLLAWVYAGASFLTLVVINGIVSFMLTPGRWLVSGSFWDAYFNPSYLPSLLMRGGASIALAGLYGLLTAVWRGDKRLRDTLVQYSSKWILSAFVLLPIGALYYMAVIAPQARALALGGAAPVSIMFMLSIILSLIIVTAVYFGPFRKPSLTSITFAVVLLALGLMATGGTEWVREGIRKPYIIYNYLYSNGVYASAKPDPKGVMSQAKWSVYGSVAAAPTPAKAGEDVFRIQCAACHTVVGYNGVTPLVAGWDQEFASHQIDRLHILKGFMPQFMGTPAERDALAVYLTGLQAQQKEAKANATAKP